MKNKHILVDILNGVFGGLLAVKILEIKMHTRGVSFFMAPQNEEANKEASDLITRELLQLTNDLKVDDVSFLLTHYKSVDDQATVVLFFLENYRDLLVNKVSHIFRCAVPSAGQFIIISATERFMEIVINNVNKVKPQPANEPVKNPPMEERVEEAVESISDEENDMPVDSKKDDLILPVEDSDPRSRCALI